MPTRSARTEWTGTLQEGSGRVELTSSAAGSFEVSFPKRASEQADGTTSPEELIGAALTSCFAMALSAGIARAGGTPVSLSIGAQVSLGQEPAGGFVISKIALSVRGRAEGIDAAGFLAAAEDAKQNCPIGKALAGVPEIVLDAQLDG